MGAIIVLNVPSNTGDPMTLRTDQAYDQVAELVEAGGWASVDVLGSGRTKVNCGCIAYVTETHEFSAPDDPSDLAAVPYT